MDQTPGPPSPRPGERGGPGALRSGALVAAAVVPALVLAALGIAHGERVNLFEDGTTVAGGLRMFAGDAPYADFFAFYGPLEYVLPAAVFRATGSVATGPVAYYLVVAILSSLAAYALVRLASGRPALALVAPVSLVLAGAAGARTLAALGAVLAVALFERSGRRAWLVVAGACVTAALLWVQDAGAWVTLAIVLVALVGTRVRRVRSVLGLREVGTIAVGGAVATLPWLVYALARGILGSWVYWTFVFPNTVYTHRSALGYLTGLLDGWRGEPPLSYAYHVVFYFLPYVLVLVLAVTNVVVASRRVRDGDGTGARPGVPVAVLVLAVYGLLQLRVLAASVDEAKLADTAAPTVTCAVALALASFPRGEPVLATLRRRPVTATWAVLAVGWLVLWPVQKAAHGLLTPPSPTSGPLDGTLGGIAFAGGGAPWSSPQQLAELRAAIDSRTSEHDRVLVLPTAPMVYVIADRGNATRYDYLDPVYTTAEVDAELAESVQAHAPALVVLGDNVFPEGPTGPQIAPRTYAAVDDGYTRVATIGGWTLYEPQR